MKVEINSKEIKNVVSGDIVNIYESAATPIISHPTFIKERLRVFISYSHKDEDIKDKLDAHLAFLKRDERIVTWNDRKILAGQEWDLKIKEELDHADLILLLISANFIASDYIWKFELTKAIERNNSGMAIVIPIFCKPCNFENMPFAKIQGLPKSSTPIILAKNMDEILTEVTSNICSVIDNVCNNSF